MPVQAGKFRHRIEFGEEVPDTESGDPEKTTFISKGKAWARRTGATMSESFSDSETHSVETYEFRVRWQRADDLGIKNDWVIKHKGNLYDIETAHDPDGTKHEYIVNATLRIDRKDA